MTQPFDIHRVAFPDHDYPILRNRKTSGSIVGDVHSNVAFRGNYHILVDDGFPYDGATTNIYAVQQHAAFHERPRMNGGSGRYHRAADSAARHNGPGAHE